MSKIRVLFITPFTTGGGAARNMFNIIRQIAASHDVRLLVTSNETVPTEYEALVPWRIVGSTSVSGACKDIICEIKEFNPDYIFATSMNVGLSASVCRVILRKSCKVIARCPVTPCEEHHKSLKNALLKYALRIGGRLIDLVIAQTEFMRKDLISTYRLSPSKVRHIPNIIDIEHVQTMSTNGEATEFDSNFYNILAVGALYSVKGFDLLIEAMSSLINDNKSLRLYIIGEERYETGYKKFLQNKIAEAGLRDSIFLLGGRDNPFPYYKAADLFVMSSRKEGFPNVVLESIALKTPVVATNVVDFSNVIIPGRNGFIVNKNSSKSLEDGIKKAISYNWDMSDDWKNYDYTDLFH